MAEDIKKVEDMSQEEMQAKIAEAEQAKADAIAQKDKISEDYRFQRSEADKLKDVVVKTKHVFEEKGLAKFDDHYNITILEKQQDENKNNLEVFDQELEEINVKFEALSEKLESGDIDEIKFNKENAKLLRQETSVANKKNAAETKQEILANSKKEEEARQQQQQQQQVTTSQQTEKDHFINKLATKFPEHASANGLPDNNSDLVKEVNAIIAEDPQAWNVKDLNENMKERYKIFDNAYNRLVAKGKISSEEATRRQQKTNAGFATLESTTYEPPKEKKSSFVNESMAGNHVRNKFGEDTLKDLNDKFNEYEESGTLVIES